MVRVSCYEGSEQKSPIYLVGEGGGEESGNNDTLRNNNGNSNNRGHMPGKS